MFLNIFLCPKNTGINVIKMPNVKLHLQRLKYSLFYVLDQQYGSAIAGWPINKSNVIKNIWSIGRFIEEMRSLDIDSEIKYREMFGDCHSEVP